MQPIDLLAVSHFLLLQELLASYIIVILSEFEILNGAEDYIHTCAPFSILNGSNVFYSRVCLTKSKKNDIFKLGSMDLFFGEI